VRYRALPMRAWIRTTRARCALAVVALGLASAVAPAAALAGGPGVTVFSRQSPQPITLSGTQIAAAADVPARTYTLRERAGSAGTKLRLRGLSMRGLLELAGVNPSSVRFVSVVRANGSLATLNRADVLSPPFPEGPALVTDEGSTTRFFRPARGAGGTSDNVTSSSAGPLEITVDGGTLLAVRATANPKQTDPGEAVTFSARVKYPPAGAHITYHWDFGDGTTAEGQRVTHTFSSEGDMQVQVAARGTNGSTAACSGVCGGVAALDVRVGNPKGGTNAPDQTPGSGTGNPLAPGSGTGAGAGGPGGTGGGNTPGATGPGPDVEAVLSRLARERAAQHARERAAASRKRDAARRLEEEDRAIRRVSPAEVTRPSGLVVTGILLAGQGAALTQQQIPRPPNERPAGRPKGVQAARGSVQDATTPIPVAALLALLVVVTGALRERRGVRLRTA
jgi:hypothetical protein